MKNEMIMILGKIKELATNLVTLCDLITSSADVLLPNDEAKKVEKKKVEAKPSFATNDEDWNNYREEEKARDALEEAKQVEEPKKVITLDEVRAVLAELSRDGKTAAVKELLLKHGAGKLSEVDSKEYESILSEAEGMKNA